MTNFSYSNNRKLNGQVAQLVEQRTENPRVSGSIPLLAIILLKELIYE
jgi:hypothetical protein